MPPPSKIVPPPRSPERKQLAARVWALLDDGISFRVVAQQIGVKSLAMVARLRDEHQRNTLTDEIREFELADLAAWQEMLNEAANLVLASDKPEKMAELAASRAKLSRERRLIMGIDKPVRSQLELRTGRGEETPDQMPEWMRQFQSTPLSQRLEDEANATE